jgi:ribosomal protein S18 acetylase RimI-like enzyme
MFMVSVREAKDVDNKGLLELESKCPMGTELIVHRDSSPDFFGRSSQYEDGHIFVAIEEDDIVGTAGCAIRKVLIGGELVSACYEFGFLVDPVQRRKGIASKLHDHIEKFAVERDVDLLNLDVLEDNLPAINLFEKKGFRYVKTLKSHIFSSIEKRPVSKPGAVHSMFEGNLEEVVALLNDTYSGYDYYKDYSADSFKEYIERIPYLKLNDILIFARALS